VIAAQPLRWAVLILTDPDLRAQVRSALARHFGLDIPAGLDGATGTHTFQRLTRVVQVDPRRGVRVGHRCAVVLPWLVGQSSHVSGLTAQRGPQCRVRIFPRT
jgi:hypothetical protein